MQNSRYFQHHISNENSKMQTGYDRSHFEKTTELLFNHKKLLQHWAPITEEVTKLFQMVHSTQMIPIRYRSVCLSNTSGLGAVKSWIWRVSCLKKAKVFLCQRRGETAAAQICQTKNSGGIVLINEKRKEFRSHNTSEEEKSLAIFMLSELRVFSLKFTRKHKFKYPLNLRLLNKYPLC